MDHLGVFYPASPCFQEPEVLRTLWGFPPHTAVLVHSGWQVKGLKFALER